MLAPVDRLMGYSVGVLDDGPASSKRAAYRCDITYGTGYEFGFDYFRDQLALRGDTARIGQMFRHHLRQVSEHDAAPLQLGHAAAIVDEADSVLIDEACLPLILASSSSNEVADARPYECALHVTVKLQLGTDFLLDPKTGAKNLTASGLRSIFASGAAPGARLERPWLTYIENALHAEHFLRRDEHYVVSAHSVHIVDEYAGRIFSERTWRHGLHQAVQAKEHLPIEPPQETAARISRQRYFT